MLFAERKVVGAVRVAMAVLASTSLAAYGQQATGDQAPQAAPQQVLITGSNIKTTEVETASPVQVITHADIQRQGVTNVADLINNLAASTGSVLNDIGGSNSFAPGATNVSFRNLGEQSTLVLLNGRRLPSYALADFTSVFVNVDAIPLDAIDHIDVLKVGASAIYGSDAVAGVINIITRTDFQGVEVSADRSQSLQSGTFGTTKASIMGGFGDYEKDGYNVLFNADFFKRDNVMWTNLLGYTNPALVATSPGFGTTSSYSYPGNFIDGDNTQPAAGCPANLIQGGLCKYNRYDRFQAVPQSDRDNFFASGTLNIGGGNQAFGEAFYSKIKTSYISAYPYYGDGLAPAQWGNPTTGQPLTMNYLGLLASDPINPTGDDGVGYRYRFTDAPSYQNVDSDEFRVLGGVRGTLAKNYDWEASVGFMGSKTTAVQQGAFSASGFIKEIGDYNNYSLDFNPNVALNYQSNDPNFFNQPGGYKPGGQNSAAVLNTLFPVFGYSGQDQQSWADAKISGPLFDMPAGQAKFAAGGEFRHESYRITPSDNLAAGDIVDYGISESDASRNTESVYGEIDIPLVKNLEGNVAVRADKYPDLAMHFSPHLQLRYTPTDWALLRGTIERGFRAPNLVESATSLKYAFDPGTSDPQRCPQANVLYNDLVNKANSLNPNDPNVALLYAQAETVYTNECSLSLADEVKNNPNLQPESSRTVSLGLVLEPFKGYSTSIDYWNINRKNTIGLESTAQLLNGGPLPPGVTLNRAPYNAATDPTFNTNEINQYGVTVDAGPLTNVVREMENISEQRTSGVDFEVKGVQKTVYGRLTLALDATYLIGYYDSSISDIHENLAGQYALPRLNGSITASLESGPFQNALRMDYIRGYWLQEGNQDSEWSIDGCAQSGFTADQCRVKGSHTFDYFFAYNGIKNLTIAANVLNVFQQRAPADLRAFGVGGVIPTSLQDAEGRMLRVSLDYKFK